MPNARTRARIRPDRAAARLRGYLDTYEFWAREGLKYYPRTDTTSAGARHCRALLRVVRSAQAALAKYPNGAALALYTMRIVALDTEKDRARGAAARAAAIKASLAAQSKRAQHPRPRNEKHARIRRLADTLDPDLSIAEKARIVHARQTDHPRLSERTIRRILSASKE